MTGRESSSWTTHWRRRKGLAGGVVEWVMWMAVLTAVLRIVTWLLTGAAWLLERVV